jgi:hypothetical protein
MTFAKNREQSLESSEDSEGPRETEDQDSLEAQESLEDHKESRKLLLLLHKLFIGFYIIINRLLHSYDIHSTFMLYIHSVRHSRNTRSSIQEN